MPIPQLDLSLSSTNNPGSPMYAGNGEFEHMARYDSALNNHTISITISNEEIGKVGINLQKDKSLDKIELPTYKMMVTDDKTNETEIYEVTRDTVLFKELKTKKVSGFSFFGIKFFQKFKFSIPTILFEPLKSEKEKFEVSKYRTMRDEYLSFSLRRENQNAYLVAGTIPEKFFEEKNTENFFFVVDNSNGQKFIGDIKYREKFIKTVPKIEVHLVKRNQVAKEFDYDPKGSVNKIIYL